MRQAIEEGFILDVLQNYMTYRAYYALEKTIDDDPELETRRAQRKVARFAALHPTALSQKVEVIVEHFRRHVQSELDGQAKASHRVAKAHFATSSRSRRTSRTKVIAI
jgi:type I restriction enzyme, R subunit